MVRTGTVSQQSAPGTNEGEGHRNARNSYYDRNKENILQDRRDKRAVARQATYKSSYYHRNKERILQALRDKRASSREQTIGNEQDRVCRTLQSDRVIGRKTFM